MAPGMRAPKPPLSDERAQDAVDEAAADPEQTALPAHRTGVYICTINTVGRLGADFLCVWAVRRMVI
jgi:hypothetical protein